MNLIRYRQTILMMVLMLLPCLVFCQDQFSIQRIELPSPFLRPVLRNAVFDSHEFIYFVTNEGMWRFDGTSVLPLNIGNPTLPPTATPLSIYPYKTFVLFDVSDKQLFFCLNTKTSELKSFKLNSPITTYQEENGIGIKLYTESGEILFFSMEMKLLSRSSMNQFAGWKKGAILKKAVHENDLCYLMADNKLGILRHKKIVWET